VQLLRELVLEAAAAAALHHHPERPYLHGSGHGRVGEEHALGPGLTLALGPGLGLGPGLALGAAPHPAPVKDHLHLALLGHQVGQLVHGGPGEQLLPTGRRL